MYKRQLLRSWAQVIEAFISGQVNVVHLLSPMTVWARFGSQVPAKVVADFHTAAVLITHDIDEALLLADRIVLLGGAPGRILGVWPVDLPQPRADLLPEMGALRLEILTRLRAALRVARGEAAKESIDVP